MTFISIIIPVYNAELYIEKCINSVVNSIKNYEIILVNDGSVDDTLKKCHLIAENDVRVKVFSKENGGASSARNFGIKKAKGKYLMFLDSDDYWASETCLASIQSSVEENPNVDLILFGAKTYNTLSEKWKVRVQFEYNDISYLKTHDFQQNLSYLYSKSLFPTSAWSVVIRRSFILDYDLLFKENIVAEDVDWMLSVMKNRPNITAIQDNFYRYHKLREGSVTSSSQEKAVKSLLYIADKWKSILNKNAPIDQILIKFLSFHFSTIFLAYGMLPKKIQQKYSRKITENLHILDNLQRPEIKLIKLLISLFGIKKGSFILKRIYITYLKYNA